MNTLFIVSALVGCTLLILQTAMQLIGLGHDAIGDAAPDPDVGTGHGVSGADHDGGFDHHHDTGSGQQHSATPLPKIIQFLSYQTVVAFLAFFGLGGLAATQANFSQPGAGVLAVAAGCLSMVVITYILKGFRGLQRDGTVRIQRMVGCPGRVYLRIPADGSGAGKVTITVQGRTVEMAAKTNGPMLPTGTPVVVARVVDARTVEVAAVESAVSAAV